MVPSHGLEIAEGEKGLLLCIRVTSGRIVGELVSSRLAIWGGMSVHYPLSWGPVKGFKSLERVLRKYVNFEKFLP